MDGYGLQSTSSLKPSSLSHSAAIVAAPLFFAGWRIADEHSNQDRIEYRRRYKETCLEADRRGTNTIILMQIRIRQVVKACNVSILRAKSRAGYVCIWVDHREHRRLRVTMEPNVRASAAVYGFEMLITDRPQ